LNQFFVFAQEKVIGRDVHSLVTQAAKHFRANAIAPIEQDNLATLFLFGLNDTTKKLEVYKMSISNSKGNLSEQVQQLGLLVKPEINNLENVLNVIQESSIEHLLLSLVKEQKSQDELKPISERVGIGGSIQLTTLVYNQRDDDLLFQIKMYDEFSDSTSAYLEMLNET